jgi:signal transduction histidine kinase
LNALARVQRKSGLLTEAVSTYEEILGKHGGVVLPGGMPLGPSAALEAGLLWRELGDSPRSLKTSLALYRSLIRGEWTLEKSEFEFFAGRVKGLIRELLADRATNLDLAQFRAEFDALAGEEAEARGRTERALRFQMGAAPALRAKIAASAGQAGQGSSSVRSTLETGGLPYDVSVLSSAAGTGASTSGTWGLIIDAARLREDVLRPALSDLFPSGEAAWVVRGRDGTALLSSERAASGPPVFKTNFISNFPDWVLEIHQPPPRLIKTFLLSRRGLYSFVFLLIAGILVFGLILTLRSVSHELELARLKSDFVSTVSHEFKSPLTSIRQLAEMLQLGRVPSEERRQKYYDVLLEQSERLALLTDNILSLAKIESGGAALKLESTDIAALVADVTASIQERVRHEGFTIGLGVDGPLPPVAADRSALGQAVTNLIDNAVKYSGGSRKIEVRASHEGQAVAIAVRDFGIGISQEDRARVFERFYRAGDALTRTVKGSGLGLALVREIVEAHRGKVLVESEPGQGSLFTILLPVLPGEGK